eukprot:TRINITY_DN14256_c0_g1_i2.p1 TRINITY_DN14256_c0_g1~~TRINITY_DN14256_c0_g1_i2.p1  ORF type:complete len:551 (+),score=95.31 TRINITY_DN14256_c0_g1_i2:210-1862(+)
MKQLVPAQTCFTSLLLLLICASTLASPLGESSFSVTASGSGLYRAVAGKVAWFDLQVTYANATNTTVPPACNWTVAFLYGDVESDLVHYNPPLAFDNNLWKVFYVTNEATFLKSSPYDAFSVVVTLNGIEVPINRSTLVVFPGETVGSNSNASGPGLALSFAGTEAWFEVSAYDQFGNMVPYGGDTVTVDIQMCVDPDCNATCCSVPASVRDQHDGTYNVTYTSGQSGEYLISVELNGEPVIGSPFSMASFYDGAGVEEQESKIPWIVALAVAIATVASFFICLIKMLHSSKKKAHKYPRLGEAVHSQWPPVAPAPDLVDVSLNGPTIEPSPLLFQSATDSGKLLPVLLDSEIRFKTEDDFQIGSGSNIQPEQDIVADGSAVKRARVVVAKAHPLEQQPELPWFQHEHRHLSDGVTSTLPASADVPGTSFEYYIEYDSRSPNGIRAGVPENPTLRHVVPSRYQLAGAFLKGRNYPAPQIFLGPGTEVTRVYLVRWVRSLEYCVKRDPEFAHIVRRGPSDEKEKVEKQEEPSTAAPPKRKRPSRAQSPWWW